MPEQESDHVDLKELEAFLAGGSAGSSALGLPPGFEEGPNTGVYSSKTADERTAADPWSKGHDPWSSCKGNGNSNGSNGYQQKKDASADETGWWSKDNAWWSEDKGSSHGWWSSGQTSENGKRKDDLRLVGEDSAKVEIEQEDPTAEYLAVSSWDELNLPKEILDGIFEMGFVKPSKIQEWTLPIALKGGNIIGQARNGSGKTAAFALAMLISCDARQRCPQGMCLCPTRELAAQNHDVVSKLGKFTGMDFLLAVPREEKFPRKALLTKAQQTVVDLVLRGHNVFLTGAAGSGKSVVLEAVNHQAKRQVALTAATGGAALLIGGETTHAWAGLGQATGSAEELVQRVRSDAAACHRWTGTTLLVIDEVSMISARLLDILDLCGRAARGTVQRPFGGLQVLLCGDFHQLPPVSRKEGWAFQAKVWAEAISISLELTEVLRTDPEEQQLALALEEVRKGQVGQSSWQFLESLASKPRPRDRCPVVVVPTNRQADQINEAALKALSAQAEVHCYSAVCMGQRTRKEVPQELCLCQGAVVVLTASIRVGPQGDVKWANGLRCCVTGFVELPRRVFDHRHPDFDPVSRSLRQFLLRHEGKLPKLQALQDTDVGEQVLYPVHFGEDTGTEDGGLVQLPLRLGWALTAHRAQGASLETGAVAMLRGLFSPGQAYVTLSRCRRAKDLWIEGLPARSSDGHVAAFAPEPEVQSFYAAMRAPSG